MTISLSRIHTLLSKHNCYTTIVVQYVYTIHAEEKLTLPRVRKLRISKKRIERVIEKPIAVDISEQPVVIAIGNLTKTLSLCVVCRRIEGIIRIITFYPAEKGRYERKIL